MADFNFVDYILLAIFLFSILAGFGRGFVREIIALLTLFAAVFVATMFSNTLAVAFTSSPGVQSAVNEASTTIGMNAAQPVSYIAIAISFALLFAGTMLLGSLIGYFINMAFQFGLIGMGNRLLGAAFGAARGFVFNVVLVFLVQLTPFSSQPLWQQSKLVAELQPAVVWLGNIVSPSLAGLKDRVGQTMQNVNSSIQNAAHRIAQ